MEKDLTIRAGWLLDGTGAPAIEAPLLRIGAGRIKAVGRTREEPPPRGTKLLDLPGQTIVPALVDAHVHLFMSPKPDPELRRFQLQAGYDDLLPTMSEQATRLREYGVLAVRDGGDYGGFSLRFRDHRPEAYPLLRSPGLAWRKKGRYGRLIGREAPQGLAREIAAQPDGPDHVKLVGSGINSLKEFGRQTAPQFDLGELRAGVEAAHARGLGVMIHANGEEPVRLAILAGCDSVEHGFFMGRENLRRMAGSGTIWVPTAVTMAGYAKALARDDPARDMAARILESQLEQIAFAAQAGVEIACGSDSGSLGVGHGPSLGRELGLLMEAGLSLETALACGSAQGAGLLGLADRLGRIAPGLEASFLVFAARPEEMAWPGFWRDAKPEAVFIQGRRMGGPGGDSSAGAKG